MIRSGEELARVSERGSLEREKGGLRGAEWGPVFAANRGFEFRDAQVAVFDAAMNGEDAVRWVRRSQDMMRKLTGRPGLRTGGSAA